jgi:magnesium-transporting ATPase (P-type)
LQPEASREASSAALTKAEIESGEWECYTKGASEIVLERCTHWLDATGNKQVRSITLGAVNHYSPLLCSITFGGVDHYLPCFCNQTFIFFLRFSLYQEMTAAKQEELMQLISQMAHKALRTLAMAYRSVPHAELLSLATKGDDSGKLFFHFPCCN